MVNWMIKDGKSILCQKSLSDAPDDYTWQTDPELAHLTATIPLTTSFTDYLLEYASQLRNGQPTKHQFAIKTRGGRHIGNCACYSINNEWGEAEIGIFIGDRRYWDKGYGTDAITSLIDFVFKRINARRIHLKTLESNKRAQKCFYKCGFTMCGSMINNGNNFILMELHRSQWLQIKSKHQ
jgi:RimJ/RimL family protein N-acetyltransferase